jgi:hypothetical protein
MPSEEFERLILKRVRGAKELLQLMARLQRKVANVLPAGLRRRAVRHSEDTVISLDLAFGVLLDFQNSDRPAAKYYAGIGLRIVEDQNVEGIAVFRPGRRDEAPVIRIGKSGH